MARKKKILNSFFIFPLFSLFIYLSISNFSIFLRLIFLDPLRHLRYSFKMYIAKEKKRLAVENFRPNRVYKRKNNIISIHINRYI